MAKQYSPAQRALFLRIKKTVEGQLKCLIHAHPEYFTNPTFKNTVKNSLAKRVAADLVSDHNLKFIVKLVLTSK